ncbi:hypothetical protein [Microbulbifer halophilus]|uniref:hypothetical protein n=1 Tax=Microbulbifer halophilus TaxID=453963 RepID=UPI0036168B6C
MPGRSCVSRVTARIAAHPSALQPGRLRDSASVGTRSGDAVTAHKYTMAFSLLPAPEESKR